MWCMGSVVAALGFSCSEACGILVLPSGMEPCCIARQTLNHWITREVSLGSLFFFFFFSSTSLLLPTHLPPPSCTHAQSCNPVDFSPPDSMDFSGKNTGVGCHFLLHLGSF